MSEVLIVRHGETDYNVEKRYCGSSEVKLNNKGMEQARALSEKLREHDIDIIISSSMKRAIQTASIIADELNKSVITVNGIHERCVGVYEGLTKEEVQEKYPELWAKKCTRTYDAAPDNGETIKDVEERVFEAINKLREEYSGQKILIVTHGFISRVINKYFNKVEEDEFYNFAMENCDICKFKFVE